jgi:hypothetical protein
MKVYVAAVSSETQNVGSLITLYDLQKHAGDEMKVEYRTRGDVARESLLEDFRKQPEFDAYLALDADQRHPANMLEQLRTDMETHNLDMVCAHYYRRETKLIQSLCYEVGDGTYPFLPMLNPPREGLHEIAWTGLGCVLIHRRVIEAVWQTLPEGQTPFAIGTLPGEANDHANWGSDVRFFIMARRLGFKLWLDAGLESLHAVTLWLGHKSANKLVDYQEWANASHDLWEERIKIHGMNIEALQQRARILEARRTGLFQQAEPLKGDESKIPELQQVTVAIYEMDGRLKELAAWLDVMQKYPAITKPADLPTTETMPPQDHSAEGTTPDEIKAGRAEMYREQAQDIAADLPTLKGNGRR